MRDEIQAMKAQYEEVKKWEVEFAEEIEALQQKEIVRRINALTKLVNDYEKMLPIAKGKSKRNLRIDIFDIKCEIQDLIRLKSL